MEEHTLTIVILFIVMFFAGSFVTAIIMSNSLAVPGGYLAYTSLRNNCESIYEENTGGIISSHTSFVRFRCVNRYTVVISECTMNGTVGTGINKYVDYACTNRSVTSYG